MGIKGAHMNNQALSGHTKGGDGSKLLVETDTPIFDHDSIQVEV